MSKRVRVFIFYHSIVSTIALAPTFKLIGNSLILGTMEVMAESLTLAEKAGVDSSVVLTLMDGQLLKHFSTSALSVLTGR